MPDLPPVGSPGVERCWRIMTGLHIATRVDAIDYLWAAESLPRLSTEEIRSLVEAFPLMPADRIGRPAVRGVAVAYEPCTQPFGGAMTVPMSRAELAEAINAYLWNRGVTTSLCDSDIGRYERGDSRWPRAHYRRALRAVLGAGTDAALGLFITRRSPSSEEPLQADHFAGGPAQAATGLVNSAVVAPLPGSPPPGCSRRVVLHWTGRRAYALRVGMRMSVRDFAAKLGVAPTVVHPWGQAATGRLRYETHRMLDTMLSAAADDDVVRFDLALQEMGESR